MICFLLPYLRNLDETKSKISQQSVTIYYVGPRLLKEERRGSRYFLSCSPRSSSIKHERIRAEGDLKMQTQKGGSVN